MPSSFGCARVLEWVKSNSRDDGKQQSYSDKMADANQAPPAQEPKAEKAKKDKKSKASSGGIAEVSAYLAVNMDMQY
jgi:hypothetical protein